MSDHQVNNQIKAKNVRLVTDSGSVVISTREALERARSEDLDLVEINPNGDIPVCKILDYGKFKFELSKKEKELAKKARQSKVELKEIQLRPVTDDNDISVKGKKVNSFIKDGNKVKIVVKFRGRETSHRHIGEEVIDKILSNVEQEYKIEKPASMNGRDMVIIIAPENSKSTS